MKKRTWVVEVRRHGEWIGIGVAATRAQARRLRANIAIATANRLRVSRGDTEAAKLLAYLDKTFGPSTRALMERIRAPWPKR